VRRLVLACGLALVLAACGAVAGSSGRVGAPTAQPPLKILVLTQTRGYHHASIPWAIAALGRVAAADGRYQLRFLPSAAVLTPAALKGAAAVVFLLTTGELPLSPAGKQALVAFVRHGGGLVGFHSATDTFHRWPAFIRMIGAEFSHHPLPSTQRIVIEDKRSPATRSLPGAFSIHEEFYVFRHDPRSTAHILARLDTGPAGPDLPLVWCRRAGGGRVFYDALGHFPQTWQDPRQVALVAGGIAWAAGLARATGC
jgi:uncharacterized protein